LGQPISIAFLLGGLDTLGAAAFLRCGDSSIRWPNILEA